MGKKGKARATHPRKKNQSINQSASQSASHGSFTSRVLQSHRTIPPSHDAVTRLGFRGCQAQSRIKAPRLS